jgi:hypothetical protein
VGAKLCASHVGAANWSKEVYSLQNRHLGKIKQRLTKEEALGLAYRYIGAGESVLVDLGDSEAETELELEPEIGCTCMVYLPCAG